MSVIYAKPPLTIEQQIALLESRGLIISDRDLTHHHLRFINYYRLSGYTISFEETGCGSRSHQFKVGTTLEDVLNLYHFDRRLRILVMSAIERIEVAIRTQICLYMSVAYQDSHWHLSAALFKDEFNHAEFVRKCTIEQQNSKEHFVRHYQEKYKHPPLTPSWMTIELLPMGTWSIVYKNLKNRRDKKKIAKTFELSSIDFESWLHVLTYIRNLCAHHSRLWNRHFTLRPAQAAQYCEYLTPNTTFAAQAAIIHVLLSVIDPADQWVTMLHELFCQYSFIDVTRMGFVSNWENEIFWKVGASCGADEILNKNECQKNTHISREVLLAD